MTSLPALLVGLRCANPTYLSALSSSFPAPSSIRMSSASAASGVGMAALSVEQVVALVGSGSGLVSRARAGALKDGVVVELKQAVHVVPPVIEGELLLLPGAQFGLF